MRGAGGATYCAVAALRLMQGGGGEGEGEGEGMEEVRRWCAQVGWQKGKMAEMGEVIVLSGAGCSGSALTEGCKGGAARRRTRATPSGAPPHSPCHSQVFRMSLRKCVH